MLFFATFAGMKHITQFNESLKKSYYRATRAFMRYKKRFETLRNHMSGKPPQDKDEREDNDLNLSTSTAASQKRAIYDQPKVEQKKIDLEFQGNFSFGTYLSLVWRIEYLEEQLKRKRLIGRGYMGAYTEIEDKSSKPEKTEVEDMEEGTGLLKFDNK